MLNLAFLACIAIACILCPIAVRLAFGRPSQVVSIERRCAQELARQMHRDIPGLAAIVERNRREAAFRAAYPGARQCAATGRWRDGRGRFIARQVHRTAGLVLPCANVE